MAAPLRCCERPEPPGVIYLGTFYHSHEYSRRGILLSAQHVEHESHPKEAFERHHKIAVGRGQEGLGEARQRRDRRQSLRHDGPRLSIPVRACDGPTTVTSQANFVPRPAPSQHKMMPST